MNHTVWGAIVLVTIAGAMALIHIGYYAKVEWGEERSWVTFVVLTIAALIVIILYVIFLNLVFLVEAGI